MDLNITKAKGRGLAVFVRRVMPLDGIGGLLIEMFLSGVSEKSAEIKAKQQATLLNAKEIHNTCTFTLSTFRKSCSGQAVWEYYRYILGHNSALTHHAC